MSSDMEMKMQAQYDGWDAQMASAAADLKAYAHNLARFGGEGCCLAIERAWSLEGLPPEIVSDVLSRVAGGSSFDAAFDAATSPQTVPEEAVEDRDLTPLETAKVDAAWKQHEAARPLKDQTHG